MTDIFAKHNKLKDESKTEFESQLKEVKKKIDRLEERFINEEMSKEIFEKFHYKLQQEKKEMEANLNKPENALSNLEKSIELAIHLASKLNTVWDSADYLQKQKLQNLVFPEGITYNRKTEQYRTIRANSAFLCIADTVRDWKVYKTENPEMNSGFSAWVEPRGVEPLSKHIPQKLSTCLFLHCFL